MSSKNPHKHVRAISLLPAPTTLPAPLDNVQGGENNLLHRSAWSDPLNPLRVEFAPWENSQPTVRDPERIIVFLGSVKIAEKEWQAPISLDDHFVTVSADQLMMGEHSLTYTVIVWSGTAQDSLPLTVTIDKEAPLLNPSSALIFPPEVLPPNKLTAPYLEDEDLLRADIPGYTTARPWDRITWFWGTSPGDLNSGGVIELNDKNYDQPLILTISGDLIRTRGDGWRYASYQIQDRAGNASQYAVSVELDVAATPVPRNLPWPGVEKAVGVGEEQILDPAQAEAGAVVVVPSEAVIYPGEQVRVQWGVPGSIGEHEAGEPITPGSSRYHISMRSIAAHLGKTLPVSYKVTDKAGVDWPSDIRKLRIPTMTSGYPTIQCDGLTGGNLSYDRVDPLGTKLTLIRWKLMTSDQWIMVNVSGVGATGSATFTAVQKRQVTDQEVIGGIGFINLVRVPKTFLNTLRRNEKFRVNVYISFDGGTTWPALVAPNFPFLDLTLTV